MLAMVDGSDGFRVRGSVGRPKWTHSMDALCEPARQSLIISVHNFRSLTKVQRSAVPIIPRKRVNTAGGIVTRVYDMHGLKRSSGPYLTNQPCRAEGTSVRQMNLL